MTARDRHQLIEKHEQGLLTDEEYGQYMDLLRNDPDFYDDVRLYQLLAAEARQEANADLWSMAGQVLADGKKAEPAPQRPRILVWVQKPLVQRVALLVLLAGFVGGGLWYYQRQISESQIISAKLPIYYNEPETGEEGAGFGSDDDTPNDSLTVLLQSAKGLPPDSSDTYYALEGDTLRLYLPTPSVQAIARWRLDYDPMTDLYQLIRVGKKPVQLQPSTKKPLPLR